MNMRHNVYRCGVLGLFAAACLLAAATPATVADLRRAFERPPDDARMMVRWWWYGPSVTKPELERELISMKQGGIGGFEVQPTYPLTLDDPQSGLRNFPYLSDEFLDDLSFTAEKAHELGLRFDLTLGSGWPFGGPHIPITQAAGRLRVDRVPVPAHAATVPLPAVADGEKFIAAFLARGDRRQFAAEGIRRLTEMDNGVVRVQAEATEGRVVLFFISSRTRQTVKRPAVGAEGFVLDHYDRAAIDTHLKMVGEPLLKAVAKNPPYAIFSDSLEVYNSDFTGNFLEEFQKRRGYDLTQYLPALAGDAGDKTKAKATLAEMGYKVHIVETHLQFETRYNQINYQVVVIEDTFAGNPLDVNPSLQFVQNLPMAQRRYASIFLLGGAFETLNTLQAFAQSVHCVINYTEIPVIGQLIQKTIAENNLFLNTFREVEHRVYQKDS